MYCVSYENGDYAYQDENRYWHLIRKDMDYRYQTEDRYWYLIKD